jgi:hypothetical protein
MCRAVIHGVLEILAGQQAIDEAGGERVAAAHAIPDLQVFIPARLRAPFLSSVGRGLNRVAGYGLIK